MSDPRDVVRAAGSQEPPPPDPAFLDRLEARLLSGPVVVEDAPAPRRRAVALAPAAAVVAVAALAGALVGLQREDAPSEVRTDTTVQTTSTTTASPSATTTSTTTVVTTTPVAPTSTTGVTTRSTIGGTATTSKPTTTTTIKQQYISMSCAENAERAVVCDWSEPPVAVAKWHVVRRLTGEDEVSIPTTSDRRITDPTAERSTTYTYVVNGKDAQGNSVVLAYADITTSA